MTLNHMSGTDIRPRQKLTPQENTCRRFSERPCKVGYELLGGLVRRTGEAADVRNHVPDILLGQLLARGRHDSGFLHGLAALLDDVEQVLVCERIHYLAVGVILRLGIERGGRRAVSFARCAVAADAVGVVFCFSRFRVSLGLR